MHQFVYVSSARWTMSDADLNGILDVSRRNNRALGLTGLLLHLDHGFLQVLEGPESAVRETFARISRDRRHTDLRMLIEQDTDGRLFGDWSMGFEKLGPGHGSCAGAFAITQHALQNAVPPEKAAHIGVLLRNFYRVNAGLSAA